MRTRPMTVYLGLGSNLGNRHHNLAQALNRLAPQAKIVRCSSVYDTAPQDNPDQPRFLNMAVRAETGLSPELLLELTKSIETALGRRSAPPNSPRPIDIDILFYGKLIRHDPDPIIPHPRLHKRAFVLIPLSEIAPRLKHPVTHQTAQEMLRELKLQEQEVIKCGGGKRCINLR